MDAKLTGLVSTEVIPKGTTLRITFVNGGNAFLHDARPFAARISAIWSQLASLGYGYPISPNPRITDAAVSVIDFRLSRTTTVADVITALSTITGYFIDVSEVQRLAEGDAKIAATNTGARQREQTKATENERQKQASDNGFFGKLSADISRTVGVSVKVIETLVIIVVIFLLLWAATKARGLATMKLS